MPENPNVTREFVDGKMVVTFRNGKSREVTVETLETRKANVATMIANRGERMQTMAERLTSRIAAETNADKKAKMQTRLDTMQSRQGSLPTAQEITDRLQGWIDAANASVV